MRADIFTIARRILNPSGLLLPVIIPFILLACNSGKPGPVSGRDSVSSSGYSLQITPDNPTRNSSLSLASGGFSLTQASIQWLVNGAVVPEAGEVQFRASDTRRDDTVQAQAILQGQTIASNVVTIENAPPEVTAARILPDSFRQGDTLHAQAEGTDADGDEVTLTYQWTKNGEPAGNGNDLGTSVRRGDRIAVTITPFDGRSYGQALTIEREIANMPPIIEEHNQFAYDGTAYTYQVKATDPDGDALNYSLESAPPGMTIDPSSGLLKWVVPRDFSGKKSVSIAVSDGHGATAKYTLQMSIQ